MKIISWNVAGFRRSNSNNTWDYSEVDIDYFAKQVTDLDPDIIQLQEVEFTKSRDTLLEFANAIGFENCEGIPMHPNHITEGQELGYAILSKNPLKVIERIVQPYPKFELKFSDGKLAIQYNKEFLLWETSGIKLVNSQMQPLQYWGYSYYEEPGYSYAKLLQDQLIHINADIICGDFQVSHLEVPFKELSSRYIDSLPNEFTRMRANGKHTKSDHILLKNGFKVKDSKIVKTQTDHYLCYCEFE